MTRWDIDKGEGYMWIASEAAKSLVGSMKKETGIAFNENLVHIKNHRFFWCLDEKEMEEVGNYLIKKFENKEFSKRFERKYKRLYQTSIERLDDIDKKNHAKLNNSELLRLMKDATGLYVRNFDFGFIMEPMDLVLPKILNQRLSAQGYDIAEIGDILAIGYESYANIETKRLIIIARRPKNSQKRLLEKHAYDYRWLHSDHSGRKDIPLTFFEDNLKQLIKKGIDKEEKHLTSLAKSIQTRKKELIKKRSIDEKTRKLLDISEIIAPLHDIRKELFLREVHTIDTLRAEFSKRYGYSKDETSWFEVRHFEAMMRSNIREKNLKELAENTLLYINKKKNIWRYYHGKEADKIADKELKQNLDNIELIKGMCASKGYAKGRVKIISSVKTMHKMEKGDIIVSSMTKPEFISAIRKAKAIVTDEGGVTCHAAIVSREFNIPCIIGTKIATHILKDEDLIEVDANKGIVKILKVK